MANANGYAIPIQLTASESFDKLMLHSEKTGNTSIYVRDNDPVAKNCSIKYPPLTIRSSRARFAASSKAAKIVPLPPPLRVPA